MTGPARPPDDAGDVHAVDLVLYVAAESAASLRARANLEALLAGYDRSRVRLRVKDVAAEVQDAEDDHVVFTPTLIVRSRGLEARAVGDLGDAAATAGLLNIGGLEKTG